MKYRKKPVVVEAVQYITTLTREPHPPGNPLNALCWNSHDEDRASGPFGIPTPHIHTLEGAHLVSDGDYIVCGIKGEFYPVKPDIFAATYELVPSSTREGKIGSECSLSGCPYTAPHHHREDVDGERIVWGTTEP